MLSNNFNNKLISIFVAQKLHASLGITHSFKQFIFLSVAGKFPGEKSKIFIVLNNFDLLLDASLVIEGNVHVSLSVEHIRRVRYLIKKVILVS